MKHHSIALLRSIPPIRRTLSALSIVLSLILAFAAFGVPVNTSWTYQGQLRRSGAAYNGTCDFQFSLWDAASAGTQQSGALAINGVNVVNGLFTVVLDFGNAFSGDSRWLGTSVQCSGDGGFTQLDPRQAITAAPYALSLRPGAAIFDFGSLIRPALEGQSFSASGIGLAGTSAGQNGVGVKGTANGTNAAGVLGQNSSGAAVYGQSSGSGPAVFGESPSTGLAGKFVGPVNVTGPLTVNSTSTTSVYGSTTNASGNGVRGNADAANGVGVFGNNPTLSSGWGVYGVGFTAVYGGSSGASGSVGVRGEGFGTTSVGVYGTGSGTNSIGVLGITSSATAVYGQSTGSGAAIYGQALGAGLAGSFSGPVNVQGTLTKSAGSFRIDHPLDPANKFLSHSFVESPDMKNIYDGNVTTDGNGNATVTLPGYFVALNRDYRYQLTALGSQFAQAIVTRKIAQNSFEIRTDKPGVEVSWQVTGIRQDAYAQAHPIVVDEFKPAQEKGKYLYPAGFGAGEEQRIGHLDAPAPPQTEPNTTK